MIKKISKAEAKKQIEEFFKDIKCKTSKDVKKIKRLGMRHNIPLKEKRKMFCKKCLTPYQNPNIKIKKGLKIVNCKNCGYVSRWRL
ncbi:MAG: hypothetical protein ABIJ14_00525 [Nanoarchaeota archaeon]|nr:hypothetical protein [Nanoarchaeota archaeon]